jgi:hypothetical protein
MFRLAWVFGLLLGMIACKNNDKKSDEVNEENGTKSLGEQFQKAELPYLLSDTALLKHTDTTSLHMSASQALLPDSLKNNYFGKTARIKYSPLAKFEASEGTYFLIKASTGSKKAALVALYDKENNFLSSYPFLFPDTDPSTSQSSSIDKSFTITRNIVQRSGAEVGSEGKEVVAYDATEKKFGLIMLDPLNENPAEIVSPIDTFPKTHKLAGDYWMNKKNLISIRDGRYPNQLMVYVHTENTDGDCKGEMRGEFLMTTSTTATFRQGGDPCILNLQFKGNTVSINEQTGCGNYRGLDCPLTGTFTKKKPASAKPNTDKPKRK